MTEGRGIETREGREGEVGERGREGKGEDGGLLREELERKGGREGRPEGMV